MISRKRILFILDLNGTLLHRLTKSELVIKAREHPQSRSSDCIVNGNPIYFRSGHLKFVEGLFELGEVAVWTSAMPKNALPMTRNVFGSLYERLLFVWTQNECEVQWISGAHKPDFKKSLTKVWKAYPEYGETTTIMIDDSPNKLREHPKNLLAIPEFLVTEREVDHTKDEVLIELYEYLVRFVNRKESVGEYLMKQPFLKGNRERKEEGKKEAEGEKEKEKVHSGKKWGMLYLKPSGGGRKGRGGEKGGKGGREGEREGKEGKKGKEEGEKERRREGK